MQLFLNNTHAVAGHITSILVRSNKQLEQARCISSWQQHVCSSWGQPEITLPDAGTASPLRSLFFFFTVVLDAHWLERVERGLGVMDEIPDQVHLQLYQLKILNYLLCLVVFTLLLTANVKHIHPGPTRLKNRNGMISWNTKQWCSWCYKLP